MRFSVGKFSGDFSPSINSRSGVAVWKKTLVSEGKPTGTKRTEAQINGQTRNKKMKTNTDRQTET